MKKVLIISYNFAPRHTVGAIRPTKLAQALAAAGHSVDVLTVRPFGELDHSFDEVFEKINHIYYIDKVIMREPVGGISQKKVSTAVKKKTLKSIIRHEGSEVMKILRSESFANEFKKLIKVNKQKFAEYDTVFSTYGPIASHLCGLVMKKYFPKVRWIADFRDPMVVNMTTPLTKGYRGGLQNKVCRKADHLIAVSNGYFERIFGKKYAHKASVIYNGFDRQDIDFDSIKPDELFSFTYVGALYDGKRDIKPLFEVFKELCDEGKLDRNDICINYAGNHYGTLLGQARQYGFEDRIIDHGMLARRKCLELQAASRHLILSTWNEKGENGVFPGKFLEYIMMGRSIISLVAGDEPNSEVSVVMKRAGLGISYEQATKEKDKESLKNYVYNDYLAYKAGKGPCLDLNKDEVNRFDFANAAKQIEELL